MGQKRQLPERSPTQTFAFSRSEETCKPWILLLLDVGEWGKLEIHYLHSDMPQDQAVCGHLALCEAHRLKLKYGEELLTGVDDLTLHAHNFLYFNKYLY